MVNDWKAYFIFSHKERKGIAVLGFILAASMVGSFIVPHKKEPSGPISQINALKVKLFKFDPNSIDSNNAALLGIPGRQIKTLMHYREKGGKFYKKQDILKLYGLEKEIAYRLIPFIEIKFTEATFEHKKYQPGNGKFEKNNWQIDINNATEKEWIIKAKLNSRIAHQIINYKNHLGEFKSIYQINKVYGLSDTLFQLLKSHLIVGKSKSFILNSSTMNFSQWKSLGIFDNHQIAQLLKTRKESRGVLSWKNLVIKFDLTQEQAILLKTKVIIND